MPLLSGTAAHWDAEASKIRYYANFDGTDEWVEVSGEDFSHLSRHFAREAVDVICDAVSSTIERLNAAMEEFFRKAMEALMPRPAPPEEREN
jgi:hypothetical protein